MLKRTIIIAFCVGCCVAASAQESVELLKEKYEANKRNIKVVREYVEALENAKMKEEAGMVIKEYMERCPVLQIEDKATYLLLNKYLFTDPYSNVFEYALYAVKKMKWDRDDSEDKAIWIANLLKRAGSVLGREDEVDKRYEVLTVLSKNLNREVEKQCDPYWKEGHYVLPVYDAKRIERLTYLVNKGELLRQDEMRIKLAIAKALHAGKYGKVVHDLETVVEMNLGEIRGSYLLAVLTYLSDMNLEKELVNQVLTFVLQMSDQGVERNDATNYYTLLGKLYFLVGDKINADKYTKMGQTLEAERMERYKDLFDVFQNN